MNLAFSENMNKPIVTVKTVIELTTVLCDISVSHDAIVLNY